MSPIEFVFGLTVFGGLFFTARTIVFAATGRLKPSSSPKRKVLAAELRASEDRARALESQLLDARLQNDQLQKQIEWHTKLLETQDRLVAQLSETSNQPRTPVALAG
jgi:hypothetical protein